MNLIYKIIKGFFLVALAMLISCNKDFMEIRKYTSNEMLHENVIVVDSVKIAEPVMVEGDVYTYLNDGSMPSIQVNNIIVGQTNGGYIRKVKSFTTANGKIIVETEQAALTDVFERLFVDDTIKLDFSQMKAISKTQTAPIKVAYMSEGTSLKSATSIINLNNTVFVDQMAGNTHVFARIIEGTIDFAPDIIRQIDISTNIIGIPTGVNSLTIGATGALTFNCEAEFTLDNTYAYQNEVTIASFNIGPFWMGPVPLYIKLGFDAGVVFNFDAEADLSAGFNAAASVTFGAQYQEDEGWSTLWNRTLTANQLPIEWSAGAASGAVVYVKPSVAVTIAGVLGPYMDVKPDLVFNGDINVPVWDYDLIAGIDGTLGFHAQIFGYSLADYNTQLFRFENVIASQSGMMIMTPTITTDIVTDITSSSAKSGGVISSDGGTVITAKGICWGANPLPNLANSVTQNGAGNDPFISNMTGLYPSTPYFVRAFATNSKGTAYGNVRMFLTNPTNYTLTLNSNPVSGGTVNGADQYPSGQQVTVTASANSGYAFTNWTEGTTIVSTNANYTFVITSNRTLVANFTTNQYTVSLSSNPLTGGTTSGGGSYNSGASVTVQAIPAAGYTFASWTEGTTVVSTNANYNFTITSNRTLVANFQSASTCPPSVSDIDGNLYQTIQIGTQCWMKENLKTTRYRNGTQIDFPGANNDLWESNNTGAFAWYDNNISWKNTYGALYNWYATVNSNNLCPQGWHVPSNSEFTSIVSFLGGEDVAGGKMKSTSTEPAPHPRWDMPNNAATNESGFSGFPGGDRASTMGQYLGLGVYGRWWSSSSFNEEHAKSRWIRYSAGWIEENTNAKSNGFSVRCLKNE